jgi:hypothetical protein
VWAAPAALSNNAALRLTGRLRAPACPVGAIPAARPRSAFSVVPGPRMTAGSSMSATSEDCGRMGAPSVLSLTFAKAQAAQGGYARSILAPQKVLLANYGGELDFCVCRLNVSQTAVLDLIDP